MENQPVLQVEHLTKHFPAGKKNVVHAVDDVSFTLQKGRTFGLVGESGCGKSSCARTIIRIYDPTSGKIILDGQDITPLDVTQRARAGVSFAFQQPVRFKGFTVRRLLELAAGDSLRHHEVCDLLGLVGLCARDYIDREVNASLSGGEIKRIEIATVLARRGAHLAIFDEPEAGIDLWSFSMLIKRFEQIHKEKKESLILISHQERIIQMADRIMVISDGKVQSIGDAKEIMPHLFGAELDSCECRRQKGGELYGA